MNPELSAAAIALLFGAAKIGLIGTVGFAIAWLRGRSRIRVLEERNAQQLTADIAEMAERVDRIEQSIDYIVVQVDQLADARERPPQQLPPATPDE